MSKINKIKLSFKKQPNNTGLYAVGNPKNETLIKINKKVVGSIIPSSWDSSYSGWKVRLMVIKKDIMEDGNSNCVWKGITFKPVFEEEEPARIWLRENIDGIMAKWDIFMNLEGG